MGAGERGMLHSTYSMFKERGFREGCQVGRREDETFLRSSVRKSYALSVELILCPLDVLHQTMEPLAP